MCSWKTRHVTNCCKRPILFAWDASIAHLIATVLVSLVQILPVQRSLHFSSLLRIESGCFYCFLRAKFLTIPSVQVIVWKMVSLQNRRISAGSAIQERARETRERARSARHVCKHTWLFIYHASRARSCIALVLLIRLFCRLKSGML